MTGTDTPDTLGGCTPNVSDDGRSSQPDAESSHRPAWEPERQVGILRACVLTLFQVLLRPNDTFQRFPASGSVALAAGFSAATLCGAAAMSWMMDIATRGAPVHVVGFVARVIPWMLIPFVAAGVLHGLLRVARLGAKGGTLTLRVMCYGVGAWAPLMWIPYVGVIAGLTWTAYVTSVALRHAHGIDGLRTSVVTIMALPLIAATALTLEYVAIAILRGLI